MENTREKTCETFRVTWWISLLFLLIQSSGPQGNANRPILNRANAHTEGITPRRNGLQSFGWALIVTAGNSDLRHCSLGASGASEKKIYYFHWAQSREGSAKQPMHVIKRCCRTVGGT